MSKKGVIIASIGLITLVIGIALTLSSVYGLIPYQATVTTITTVYPPTSYATPPGYSSTSLLHNPEAALVQDGLWTVEQVGIIQASGKLTNVNVTYTYSITLPTGISSVTKVEVGPVHFEYSNVASTGCAGSPNPLVVTATTQYGTGSAQSYTIPDNNQPCSSTSGSCAPEAEPQSLGRQDWMDVSNVGMITTLASNIGSPTSVTVNYATTDVPGSTVPCGWLDYLPLRVTMTGTCQYGGTFPNCNPPPPLTVSFTTTTPVYTGQAVRFTANVTGGTAYTFSWSFGDGASATGNPADHTYAAAGTYNAAVIVTDQLGRAQTATAPVTVAQAPVALTTSFTYTGSPVIYKTANFTASVNGGTAPFTYSWKFGDGGTGTGSSTSHTFTAVGFYNVTLTVTDSTGKMATAVNSVTVTSGTGTGGGTGGSGGYGGGGGSSSSLTCQLMTATNSYNASYFICLAQTKPALFSGYILMPVGGVLSLGGFVIWRREED